MGGPPPLRSRHASSPQTGSGSSAYNRSISTPPQTMATFLVGDDSDNDEEEDGNGDDTKRGYFSDPECEEVMDKNK